MIEELYEAYYKELTGFIGSLTNDANDAEEIVQECFLRALREEALLTELGDRQRRAWLYRTAKHLFIDRCRKARHECFADEIEETADASEEDFEAAEWADLLSALPGLEATFLWMRYVEGYNATQIGSLFQTPPGTVRSTLSSARKHVRELLT